MLIWVTIDFSSDHCHYPGVSLVGHWILFVFQTSFQSLSSEIIKVTIILWSFLDQSTSASPFLRGPLSFCPGNYWDHETDMRNVPPHCNLCVLVGIYLSTRATRCVTFCVCVRVCVSVLRLCPGTLFNSPNLLERFQMCRPVIYGPCLWWGMIKRCCLILWTLHSHTHYLLPEHKFIKSKAREREREDRTRCLSSHLSRSWIPRRDKVRTRGFILGARGAWLFL